jgi:hypothetical protein
MSYTAKTNQPTSQRFLNFDSDSNPLHIDNCCSYSITISMDHFISSPRRIKSPVQGIGGSLEATHVGTVKWHIADDEGRVHAITLPGTYLVVNSPARLLSPQHWAQTAKDHFPHDEGTCCITNSKEVKLYWGQRKFTRTAPLQRSSNVGVITTAGGIKKFTAFCSQVQDLEHLPALCFDAHLIPADDDEDPEATQLADDSSFAQDPVAPPPKNPAADVPHALQDGVSPTTIITFDHAPTSHVIEPDVEPFTASPHDELLRWHYRLGHLPFSRLQSMAANGHIPARLSKIPAPFCAACKYGKLTRTPWRTKGTPIKGPAKAITQPGQCVSVDQLESRTPGFIAQLKGILTTQRYKYATVFVDQFSRFTFVYLQKQITSEETVLAKVAFERQASIYNVIIKHYHCDNGRFADHGFINHCNAKQQTITYCGVNAHFQNGLAEKTIRDQQDQARTMLLYAVHKWPSQTNLSLWPYALRTATEVANITPTKTGAPSPLETFTGVPIRPQLRHYHTFGSPVYCLDKDLQAGKSVPKWQARSRLGIYLGPSPNHARSVSLVLNPTTGHVSPQFHLRHDDFFETVTGRATDFTAPPAHWKTLSRIVNTGPTVRRKHTTRAKRGEDSIIEAQSTPIEVANLMPEHMLPEPEGALEGEPEGDMPGLEAERNINEEDIPAEEVPNHGSRVEVHRTRSGREVRPPQRYPDSLPTRTAVAWEVLVDQEEEGSPTAQDQYELQEKMLDPIAFAASNDPDTMYFHEAMKAPDKCQFQQAVDAKIKGHIEGKHWEEVSIEEVPLGTRILDAVWAMRRKRRLGTGEIYKWKARLNVHGGQQEYGINYWETYAPVVAWPVIRFFFTLSLLFGWYSRQLYFVMAFPQAPIEVPLYMKIPPGYTPMKGTSKNRVLRLLRNLYGQKQGPRVWNQYLEKGLRKIGFRRSQVCPCLFFRGNVALIIYVDDCILFSPSSSSIDQAINDLRKAEENYTLEDQGEVHEFLGIQKTVTKNGAICLSQPQLIDSILKDLQLQSNSKPRTTPAPSSIILHKDEEGEPMNSEEFHYRRVVGKLNFLGKSTRPDIAYSVHQCARFSENPKASHAKAIKAIGRYLQGTRNKGIVLDPVASKSFECWADADFSGNWKPETAHNDPITAKSRSGWIITYANCPITWTSKLQTLTALSTTEAEYIALSSALRDQLPLMDLLKEVVKYGIDLNVKPSRIFCKCFEDNAGALELARLPKLRPRTKHINVCYHHFRDHVASGEVEIHYIPTEHQIADVLTKPLAEEKFVAFRKAILQW